MIQSATFIQSDPKHAKTDKLRENEGKTKETDRNLNRKEYKVILWI
jgi:hypothetical protein